MTGKVIPLKPSEMNPQTASQIIREIAAETSRVVILDHASAPTQTDGSGWSQASRCSEGQLGESPVCICALGVA